MIVYVWTVKKHGLDVDNKKGRLERERERADVDGEKKGYSLER